MHYADAKQIVVADDKDFHDKFTQSLLKMATPKGVKLILVDLKAAKEQIKNSISDEKTLFLVRGPIEANEILEDNSTISKINVGNLNMKKGKTRILDNLWVYEEDLNAIKELDNKNIELEYKTVPSDNGKSVIELIKNNI